jgi:hypothetical protein
MFVFDFFFRLSEYFWTQLWTACRDR